MTFKSIQTLAILAFGGLIGCQTTGGVQSGTDSDTRVNDEIAGVKVPASFWDGDYSVTFPFQMSPQTNCPRQLPIQVNLSIKDLKIAGEIVNQGNPENTYQYCDKYHSGSITGELLPNGTFKSVKIQQSSGHARQYASYKVVGSMTDATLKSRASQFHPDHSFSFVSELQVSQKLLTVGQ